MTRSAVPHRLSVSPDSSSADSIGVPGPPLATLRQLAVRGVAITLAAAALLASGCDEEDVAAVAENGTAAPTVSPDKLLVNLQTTHKDFEETVKLFKASSTTFRRQRLRTLLKDAEQTWQQLSQHPEADPPTRAKAQDTLAKVLYHGMDVRLPGAKKMLTDLHREMLEQRPGQPGTAVVDAMLLERSMLDGASDHQQTMTALTRHAKQFPGQPTGLALFHGYATRLRKAKEAGKLKQCCQVGLNHYGRMPQAKGIKGMLDQVYKEEREEMQRQAKLNRLIARLGGHTDGYFVMYTHPKRVQYLSPIDYRVCHGLREVSRYIERTENKGWVWELKRWCPDTSDGKKEAMAYRNELVKENVIWTVGS